jgi:hypothetical protein
VDVGHDRLSDTDEPLGEPAAQVVPLVITRQHGTARPEQPQDLRWALEGTEHERDASVLGEMRRGLVATAGQVEIPDLVGRQHPERVLALGRQIDVTVR